MARTLEERRAYDKRWKQENREHVREYEKQWRAANKHKTQAYQAKTTEKLGIDWRRTKNRETYARYKEAYREKAAEWKRNNPDQVKAQVARRRAAKKNRVPKWLSKDDLWIIKEAYSLAFEREKMTGFKWHVDHIIPLQGATVSGLHVPSNIQVIPEAENLKKGNRYDGKG